MGDYVRYGVGGGKFGSIPNEAYLADNDVAAPLVGEDFEYMEYQRHELMRNTHIPENLMPHEQPLSAEARRFQSHERLNVGTGGTRTTVKPYLADGADLSFLHKWRDHRVSGGSTSLADGRADAEKRFSRLPRGPEAPLAVQSLTGGGSMRTGTEIIRLKQREFYDAQARTKFDNDALMTYTSGTSNTANSTRARTHNLQVQDHGPQGPNDAKLDMLRGSGTNSNSGRNFQDVPQGRFTVSDHVWKVGSLASVQGRKVGHFRKNSTARHQLNAGNGIVTNLRRDASAGNKHTQIRVAAGMTNAIKAREKVTSSTMWGASGSVAAGDNHQKALGAEKNTAGAYVRAVRDTIVNSQEQEDAAKVNARAQSTGTSGRNNNSTDVTVEFTSAINNNIRQASKKALDPNAIARLNRMSVQSSEYGDAKKTQEVTGRKFATTAQIAARNSKTITTMGKGRSFRVASRKRANILNTDGRVGVNAAAPGSFGGAKSVDLRSGRATKRDAQMGAHGGVVSDGSIATDAMAFKGRGSKTNALPSLSGHLTVNEESNWTMPGM